MKKKVLIALLPALALALCMSTALAETVEVGSTVTHFEFQGIPEAIYSSVTFEVVISEGGEDYVVVSPMSGSWPTSGSLPIYVTGKKATEADVNVRITAYSNDPMTQKMVNVFLDANANKNYSVVPARTRLRGMPHRVVTLDCTTYGNYPLGLRRLR